MPPIVADNAMKSLFYREKTEVRVNRGVLKMKRAASGRTILRRGPEFDRGPSNEGLQLLN
jgi:hypothetical protein